MLPGGDGPKYRNTSETALYHKSRVLYGLNWAKSEIVNVDEVIICEGYTDVIGFAAAEVPRAVATCGTALTEDHVVQLRKFARRVVLAFDPDSAGKAAADRVYAWERSHDIDVAVVELPEGGDPADLARRDPELLRQAVAEARPFLGYRVERVLAGAQLDSPEGRARAAEAALAVIAEHPSDLVRDPYVMEVADRCRLDAEQLRERLARGGFAPVRARTGAAHGEPDPSEAPPVDRTVTSAAAVETEALRAAVHRPEAMLDLLDGVLFADPLHRAAFEALRDAGGDVHVAAEIVGPDGAGLLARVAVEPSEADPVDVAALLVDRAGTRALAALDRDAAHRGRSARIRALDVVVEAASGDPAS